MTAVANPSAGDRARAARFKRILVALDSAGDGPDVVDLVAALAAQLDANLFGLFVEDIDLLHLAGLPRARAFSTLSAGRATLDQDLVERAMRVRVALFRKAVEEAARRRRIRSSFEVRRGRVVTEVIATAEDADLVVMSWTGGVVDHARGQARLPATVERVLSEGPARSVLLLRRGAAFDGPILVAYDGTPSSERALEAALQMARGLRGPGRTATLEVVLITSGLEQVETWHRDLGARLAERGLTVRFLHLWEGDAKLLCRAARRDHATILVLGWDLPLLRGEGAQAVLGQSESSILLVR